MSQPFNVGLLGMGGLLHMGVHYAWAFITHGQYVTRGGSTQWVDLI